LREYIRFCSREANNPFGLSQQPVGEKTQFFPSDLGNNFQILGRAWAAALVYQLTREPAALTFAVDQVDWVLGKTLTTYAFLKAKEREIHRAIIIVTIPFLVMRVVRCLERFPTVLCVSLDGRSARIRYESARAGVHPPLEPANLGSSIIFSISLGARRRTAPRIQDGKTVEPREHELA